LSRFEARRSAFRDWEAHAIGRRRRSALVEPCSDIGKPGLQRDIAAVSLTGREAMSVGRSNSSSRWASISSRSINASDGPFRPVDLAEISARWLEYSGCCGASRKFRSISSKAGRSALRVSGAASYWRVLDPLVSASIRSATSFSRFGAVQHVDMRGQLCNPVFEPLEAAPSVLAELWLALTAIARVISSSRRSKAANGWKHRHVCTRLPAGDLRPSLRGDQLVFEGAHGWCGAQFAEARLNPSIRQASCSNSS